MFLYILQLTKYNCIKIGVAKNHNRIKQHIKTYGEIGLEDSYIIHAMNGDTIRQLEKQLLEDYVDYKITNKNLMCKDGYTELREVIILNDVLRDIEYKSKKFENKEIKVIKGIELSNKTHDLKKEIINNETIQKITEETINIDELLLFRSKLSLVQNNIIDILVSDIVIGVNEYELNISDYASMLNTDTSNIYRDIKKSIMEYNLSNDTILLRDGTIRYIRDIIKFSYIDSKGIIFVIVDEKIQNYLSGLKIEKSELKNILNFKSIYSQRLYYYINNMAYDNVNCKIEKIENLRYLLNVPKTYSNFSNLRKYCLDVAEKEINNSLDINFKYTVLRNTKIYGVSFSI